MLSAFRLFLTALPSELKEPLIGVNVGQVCFASYRLKLKPIFKVECVYFKLRAISMNGTPKLATTYKISQAIDVLPSTTQNRTSIVKIIALSFEFARQSTTEQPYEQQWQR